MPLIAVLIVGTLAAVGAGIAHLVWVKDQDRNPTGHAELVLLGAGFGCIAAVALGQVIETITAVTT